LNKIITI